MGSETFTYRVVDGETGPSVNSYNLSDGTYTEVVSVTGVGIAEAEYALDQSSGGWASRIHSLALKPRTITLNMIWGPTTTESAAVTRRDDLYKIFKPYDPGFGNHASATNEVRAHLRITRADSSIRDIECYPVGMTDFPYTTDDAFASGSKSGRISVKLLAPDPTFFEPTFNSLSDTTMSGTGSGSFSPSVEDATWFMYPVFTVEGPFTTLSISSAPFTHSFAMASIPDATTLEISPSSPNLAHGLRVRNTSTGADDSQYLSNATSGFPEFYLPPQWFNNAATTDSISYSYTGGDAGSSLTMEWYKRFIGA